MAGSLGATELAVEIRNRRATAAVFASGGAIFVRSSVPISVPGAEVDVGQVRLRQGVRNLLVDLDDTLVFNLFADRVFPQYIDYISERSGASPFEVKRMILEEHYALLSKLDPRCFDWEIIAKDVARRLGVELNVSLQGVQEEVCRGPFLGLLDGAREFLERAKGLGLRLFVYSNGYSKYQLEVMRRLGLDGLFDGLLTPQELGATKASREFYRGFSPSDTVVVGDNYFFDVEAPSELLFDTVWVYERGKMPIGGFQFVEGKTYYFVPSIREASSLL